MIQVPETSDLARLRRFRALYVERWGWYGPRAAEFTPRRLEVAR